MSCPAMDRKNRYRNVLWVLFLGLTLGMSVEALAASDAWAIEDASAFWLDCPICKSFLQPMQRLRLKTRDTSLTYCTECPITRQSWLHALFLPERNSSQQCLRAQTSLGVSLGRWCREHPVQPHRSGWHTLHAYGGSLHRCGRWRPWKGAMALQT